MVSMITNALRQIAEFLFQKGMIIAITALTVGVLQYFIGFLPIFGIFPGYIRVAFTACLVLFVWLKVRTHFSQG